MTDAAKDRTRHGGRGDGTTQLMRLELQLLEHAEALNGCRGGAGLDRRGDGLFGEGCGGLFDIFLQNLMSGNKRETWKSRERK